MCAGVRGVLDMSSLTCLFGVVGVLGSITCSFSCPDLYVSFSLRGTAPLSLIILTVPSFLPFSREALETLKVLNEKVMHVSFVIRMRVAWHKISRFNVLFILSLQCDGQSQHLSVYFAFWAMYTVYFPY